MLADIELIGIPHRLVIGERGLVDGLVEYQNRRNPEKKLIQITEIVPFIKEQIGSLS